MVTEHHVSKKEKAGKNWEKVTAVLGKLDKKQKEDLEEAVAKRSNQVRDSRNGKAAIELRQFGIEFTRLTLISIKSEGETAKAADLKAKEIQERRSELFENETDILLAKQLIIESRKNDEHLTTKKAYGIIREFKLAQTRGYVVPGLIETIGNLAEKIVGSKSTLPRN